jgi:predicted nucleic acid-binding protein
MPPPLAYFDTSAIVKRYVEEPGSQTVRKLLWEHRLLSSAIAPVELVSAICQQRAGGALRRTTAGAILRDIEADRAYWQLAEVSEPVLRLAERIVQAQGLSSLDAIHVASAQTAMTVFGGELPFITADGPQRDAATRIGFQVIWVS